MVMLWILIDKNRVKLGIVANASPVDIAPGEQQVCTRIGIERRQADLIDLWQSRLPIIRILLIGKDL